MDSPEMIQTLDSLPDNLLQEKPVNQAVVAELGSTVMTLLVFSKDDTETFEFVLVRDKDADIKNNKISTDVAVGRAVLGRKSGDKSYYLTPDGSVVGVDIDKVENPNSSDS